MNQQEYILSQLDALKAPLSPVATPATGKDTVEAVLKALLSKKFRKYSIPEKNLAIIRAAVEKNISNQEPIQITFPFGGYKLWRFEEAPEVDWAELFSMMHFIQWLKPVCALYPKGVAFTFWFDEVMISRMNNIPQSDLDAYQKSFRELLKFIQPWAPANMQFEVFLERAQYENNEVFERGLAEEMEKLREARAANPQPLSDAAKRSIEMNVKLSPEQEKDPLWREKIDLMHYAYYHLQEKQNRIRPSYTTAGITAFAVFFEPNVIPIGTTKTSIVRFWVGVGVLQKRGNSFIENILSVTQLEKATAVWKPVHVEGLEGKNFTRIRVIG